MVLSGGVNVESGFYAAFTGLSAETKALELAANNLANISTTGYKAQLEFYKSLTASLATPNQRPLSTLNQAINNYGVLGGAKVDVQPGTLSAPETTSTWPWKAPGSSWCKPRQG